LLTSGEIPSNSGNNPKYVTSHLSLYVFDKGKFYLQSSLHNFSGSVDEGKELTHVITIIGANN